MICSQLYSHGLGSADVGIGVLRNLLLLLADPPNDILSSVGTKRHIL